ncbi:3-deoxy-manno-octulosonate cytidylyltransferase (CMP-KDO synthetase) [Lewinella marina]|uniref:3-deoxy-manno-octulosonate cytidylyltransferase n=1 Tax=Neolewinella marina TaxID=438751 RepID=A0A2G0CHS7_9BACT|nr:3-deoxy-manno-octulosonate cytidylyltransferase [Neolewinella marina]NJB85365.1 3-deoxy-manno-octulosonate cytidylyltransferase (CMP-KDO synthetase) [Neolewinella marina]PHK99519.1 3-deoxy-manno-octulosonate cytidylyltransferase [Neolewinella marina]
MVLAVIPARYASSRLPGKPLVDVGGETLVQRVYGAVRRAGVADEVVVATDDQRIFDHVTGFGGQVVMTSPDHPSGTDRVAEAARQFPDASIVINVQGDEPFVSAEQLSAVTDPFAQDQVSVATLATRIRDEHALLSPNVVKVVRGDAGQALYFSRHAIPYLRDVPIGRWIDAGKHLQHIGLYAFRAAVLEELTALPPARLEGEESLEQLRWLAAGYRIHVALTDSPSLGVDTPADLEEAIRRLRG